MPEGKCNVGDIISVFYLGKTEVVEGSTSPKWDQVFSATVPRNLMMAQACFQLNLYDKDEGSKDDPMGVVHVPIQMDKVVNSKASYKNWYKVETTNNKEAATGKVQCTVKLSERMEELKHPKDLQQDLYVLKLKVIQAEGLAAKDTNSLGIKTASDPYVIVRLLHVPTRAGHHHGIVLGQTEYIPQSLNPKWNETFNCRVPIDELDKKADFELTIMDRDDKTADDLMGRVLVPVEVILQKIKPDRPTHAQTAWFRVS